jgi:hypothetical protein
MKNLYKLSQVTGTTPVPSTPATGANISPINPAAAAAATMTVVNMPQALAQMRVDSILPQIDTAMRNLFVQLQQSNDPRQGQVNTILGQLNGLKASINTLKRS